MADEPTPGPTDAVMCMGCQGTGMDTTGRMYANGTGRVTTMWTGTRCRHCRGTGWLCNGPANPPPGSNGGPWRVDGTTRLTDDNG